MTYGSLDKALTLAGHTDHCQRMQCHLFLKCHRDVGSLIIIIDATQKHVNYYNLWTLSKAGNGQGYFVLETFFGTLDFDGVGMPLGLDPIPVAVWAVDTGETGLLAGLGMWLGVAVEQKRERGSLRSRPLVFVYMHAFDICMGGLI